MSPSHSEVAASGIPIPNLQPTKDGSCASDLELAADAAGRGWWTCGGYTSPMDIVACPDKYTWGVSFDDGPGPYSALIFFFAFYFEVKETHVKNKRVFFNVAQYVII